MGLQPPIAQADFSAGMVRVAPHLLPRSSAWRLPNMVLDDDGSAFKRGGTQSVTNEDLAPLLFIWDGELAAGHRTVFATSGSLGVIGGDGETPIVLGEGGLSEPMRPAVIDGLLFVGVSAYGGSRKTAGYTAGTVAVTKGSDVVVGTGTSWIANVDAGMVLTIDGHLVAVANVVDDTHVQLVNPWGPDDAAGLAYSADPVAPLPAGYVAGGIYGVAGGRLLSGTGDRVYEAQGGDSSIHSSTEYQVVPQGEVVLAIDGLADLAYVFTSGGIWAITNVPFDITDDLGDSQQQVQRVSGDIVLWGAPGLAYWEETLIVPALDGVWLVGPGSPPQLLSRSITPLYREYVRQGYRPGLAAVWRGTYYLPILDSTNAVITLLTCKIDRPIDIRGFGRVFGWTDWSGAGGNVAALSGSTAVGAPRLLGADHGAAGRVLEMPAPTPDGQAHDHDGSAFEWGLVSRDFATGPLNVNFVKKVQLRYELISALAVATLSAAYGTDQRPPSGLPWGTAVWGVDPWTDATDPGFTALAEEAPESLGDSPFRWRINKKTRYLRFRATSRDACTRGVIRSVELFVRPSGRMYG